MRKKAEKIPSERHKSVRKAPSGDREFRAIFELSSVGMTERDAATGLRIRVNQKLCEMTGYSAEELLKEKGVKLTHPDDRERNREARTSVLKGESDTWFIEKRYVRKNGEVIWVHVNGNLIRDSSGQPYRTVAVIQDITERKHAEEMLRQRTLELETLTGMLEKRIQERTKELAKSHERLHQLASQLLLAQEKERKRVAVELHDGLLSELAAMKMLFEAKVKLLEQGNLSDLSEFKGVSDILARVIKECRRMMNNLHPSVLDELGLLAAINWLCSEYQRSYPHIRCEKQIGVLEADISDSVRVVIFRILQEALNNFAKHGKGNRVDLSLSKLNGAFALTILDNGQGFDVENARKGLGLESMRERVELSGGEFQIESVIGQGTTIRAIWKSS